MSHVRDYSRLAADLNSEHAPRFVWISPNQCNDMHGGVYVPVPGHPEAPCPYGSAKDDANDAALSSPPSRTTGTWATSATPGTPPTAWLR